MKTRKLSIFFVTAIAAVSLAACSAGPSEDKAPADANTSAPASETTVKQACLDMTGPLNEASQGMTEAASASATNPQAAVDAYTTLADSFASISASSGNAEVADAAAAVAGDFTAARDALQKVVDGDLSAVSEVTEALTPLQASYNDLMTLCTQ
ncbi:hypothetical protein QBL02_06765 [Leucobacter sp. UT-8R-CII-1-4]|uniref:hypothetical protein n=1 Tax=Leucobacter sp. UT-8R-CII-1-4 TaxID=3040075 RepID=UPI0024A805B5|nr:hypothetical protein [Leucobacter sp. UT-8R-CII-1-4]MDI6023243.1 hypothetical protein [Leucobacter sp. UT-8R-CII-1-4]